MQIEIGQYEYTECWNGVLPVKVKDGVVLRDWVHAIVVPAEYRDKIGTHIPEGLSEKVCFVERNGVDIWKWSEIVYEYAIRLR